MGGVGGGWCCLRRREAAEDEGEPAVEDLRRLVEGGGGEEQEEVVGGDVRVHVAVGLGCRDEAGHRCFAAFLVVLHVVRRAETLCCGFDRVVLGCGFEGAGDEGFERSEEHTSELQSQSNLVCRLLLEKKK